MTDPSDDLVVDRLAPEESFERLAHEIRFGTLQALDRAGPLSHARLRDEVGVDDPGQFNYHLQKLDGQFVREREDGYDLTPAGRRVLGAIRSGGYTSDLADETVPADADCLRCGGPLETHLEDEGAHVSCRDCGQRFNSVDIPPAVFEDSSRNELFDLVEQWVKRRLSIVEYGFCPRCDGRIDRRVVRTDDEGAWAGRDDAWLEDIPIDAVVRNRCTRCDNERHAMVPAAAVLHPAVAGFHYDHGIDVRETPMTELDWLEMGAASVESTDPLAVSVPIDLETETLVVTFDADFDLIERRRR